MASLARRLSDALALAPPNVLAYVASLAGDSKPDVHRSKKRKATSEGMCVERAHCALTSQLVGGQQPDPGHPQR